METISSNRPKIVVIGSCNTDMVVKANRLPVPGETILGGTFYMNPGGKGANQAIAAARLGAEVTFISKIGYDLFGLQALEIYNRKRLTQSLSSPTRKAHRAWRLFPLILSEKTVLSLHRVQVAPSQKRISIKLKKKSRRLILYSCNLKFR